MRVVITGAAGFIGSNFVHHMVATHPDYTLIAVDKLTYAGNLDNLDPVLANRNVSFVRMDVCEPAMADVVRGADGVVHLAAESHVDRSIEDAAAFVRANVEGTWNMLECCRRARVSRYVQVSTDEVYGSLAEGQFAEDTPLSPNSPYSATKGSGDLLVRSYVHTFGIPAVITRCSNNYGPYQFPEKFLPLMILQAIAARPLPVYGDGLNVRDWIHVSDHSRALDLVLHEGVAGEVYNVGGECELPNIEVARCILRHLGRPESLISLVKDRPGHDRRYAINCSKIKTRLGWFPQYDFTRGLVETIAWYRDNNEWVEKVRTGEYVEYFERHYVHRIKTLSSVTKAGAGTASGKSTSPPRA